MSDSPQKRKRPIVVRANAQQIEALQAAFRVDKVFSSEDYEKLSSETGLTSKWIKSWMARVRSRKKEQDRERGLPPSSDLEDLPPPPKKRRTRPAQGPPARATPKLDVGLPPADDAYIPPSKNPSLLPQVSTSIPHNSRSSSFTSAHHKTVRLEPLVSEGSLPWHPTPPISTLMDPKYLQSSFAPPNRIPEPPMLLPPDWAPLSRSTDNAALQLASARGTSTHTPNATAYHPFLPAFAANTSEFHPFAMTPAFSKSIPPATILRASLFSANRPHVSQSAPREYSFKSTPVHALQSHFVSDHYNESSKHMDTFISPSPFVPDIELNDFKPAATPSVGTPVDDRVLFSSMLNLAPHTFGMRNELDNASPIKVPYLDASSLLDIRDIAKTPLKHLTVLTDEFQRREGARMTEDEVYERLLDSRLAASDPFQAAMGLVFMSRAGLNW